MNKVYAAKITKEFIDYRDARALEPKWLASSRDEEHARQRADYEFAEWHQSQIDPGQTLLSEDPYGPDTLCQYTGNNDYKYLAFHGALVENHARELIEQGRTDVLRLWKWVHPTKPFGPSLKLGQEVEYQICGIVNGKESLKHLKRDAEGRLRLQYPINKKPFDFDKAMEEIHGTRMDQNYYFFQK